MNWTYNQMRSWRYWNGTMVMGGPRGETRPGKMATFLRAMSKLPVQVLSLTHHLVHHRLSLRRLIITMKVAHNVYTYM